MQPAPNKVNFVPATKKRGLHWTAFAALRQPISNALCSLRGFSMAFSESEKSALLEVKGVGPTVVKRFEEIGIDSFAELANYEPKEIAERVASMLRTTCWKNSPQALSAVQAAIERARLGL